MTTFPVPTTREELAGHLRLHDIESPTNVPWDWDYDVEDEWPIKDLVDAHACDHEQQQELHAHKHDGDLR